MSGRNWTISAIISARNTVTDTIADTVGSHPRYTVGSTSISKNDKAFIVPDTAV